MSILISINPPYAEMILSGYKNAEFRKRFIDTAWPGEKIYIYETKNKGGCGMVVGEATISNRCMVHNWNFDYSYMTDTAKYIIKKASELNQPIRQYLIDIGYGGKEAIFLKDIKKYNAPVPLNIFGLTRPPQSMMNTERIKL